VLLAPLLFLVIALFGASAGAQMPDLRTMTGKPLPSADLPGGTVSVRVAQQLPANPVIGVEVTAEVTAPAGPKRTVTAKTGADGRATFDGLPAGARFRARVIVNGEALESEAFSLPAMGGTRLMLIAGLDAAGPAPGSAAAVAGAEHGEATSPRRADTFRMGASTGTVAEAGDLPRGSLELALIDAHGQPMANREVRLGEVRLNAAQDGREIIPHQAISDESGRVRFTDLTTGENNGYAAVIEHEGMRLSTTPFRMSTETGMRGQIRAIGHTSSTSDLRIDNRSQLAIDLAEEAVAVVVDFVFRNLGREIFDPGPEGLLYPLADGFAKVQELSGGVPVEGQPGRGALIKAVIPPDSAATTATRARFVFFVRSENARSLDLELPMPFGMEDPFVVVREKTGITLRGTGLRHIRDAQDGDGSTVKLYSLPAIGRDGTLKLTVENLPVRSRTGHQVITVLCGMLVLALVVWGRAPKRTGGPDPGAARQALMDQREKLFSELVALEQERRHPGAEHPNGVLADRRREIIGRLETVYRELGSLEQGAPPPA
jgi:hypothetical protein